MDRWAAGESDWDSGRTAGDVTVDGPETAWPRWLAATDYLLSIDSEIDTDADTETADA